MKDKGSNGPQKGIEPNTQNGHLQAALSANHEPELAKGWRLDCKSIKPNQRERARDRESERERERESEKERERARERERESARAREGERERERERKS